MSLKVAIVTPIHKKGDSLDCNNYLPVLLTSNLSKLLENTYLLLTLAKLPLTSNPSVTSMYLCVSLLLSIPLHYLDQYHLIVLMYDSFLLPTDRFPCAGCHRVNFDASSS